jgi:hypothetical protein
VYHIQGNLSAPGTNPPIANTGWQLNNNDIVTTATTNINFGAYIPANYFGPNNPPTNTPFWNRNGTNAYYSFLRKVMLHEAGHPMGLDEANNQQAGQTVMNGPNSQNDNTSAL